MIIPLFEVKNLSYIDNQNNIDFKIFQKEIHSFVIRNPNEQDLLIYTLQNNNDDHMIITFEDKKINSQIKEVNNKHNIPIIFFQKYPLVLENLSIAENVNLMHLPKLPIIPFINWRKINTDTINIFNKLDLNYNPKEKAFKLSSEDKKFIYLCRILKGNPKLIIMHEPLENLSAEKTSKMYNLIRDFKDNGGSIILITKQWENALRISDNITIINNNKIISKMTAAEANSDPKYFMKKIEGYGFKGQDSFEENNKKILESVFKAAEYLTSEYELKDVLLLLVKEVCRFMQADGCSIQLFDEETWYLIDKFEYVQNNKYNFKLTPDAIANIAKSDDIFYINKRNNEFDILFEKNDKIKTLICIPLLIRSQVTGLITIYFEDLYVYSKEESQYLSALAKHAAIAIEDTRLMGRSALLRESHHRIKNNLQSIIGLILLQKQVYKLDPEKSIDELLDSVINRVKGISTVHDLLSRDKMGRSIINLKSLIQSIVKNSIPDAHIKIHLKLENFFIPYNKATSIALIVNEIIINSQKHAFKNKEDKDYNEINILSYKQKEYLIISVSDNGVGIPEAFNINNTKSLGLNLIKEILENELNGILKIESSMNQGSVFTIQIPLNPLSLVGNKE